MAPRARLAAAGVAAALLAAGILAQVLPGNPDKDDRPELGLFTSLPIYWSESEGVGEALDGGGAVHWARTALEEGHRLVPLDTLDGDNLARLERLVMAQPQPLAPAENVALDDWVRGGGRLLLFADPFLTEHSRFLLGDKRRPQDMVVLSPIMRRWGLELRFDEDQPAGERTISFAGTSIPVEMVGTFARIAPGAASDCALSAGDAVARCQVGKGEVLLLADAALFDRERPAPEPLAALSAAAFTR